MQEAIEALKEKVNEQEQQMKDVLIVPQRMEYKADGLRADLKKDLEAMRAQNASELKQLETYIQTLHNDIQAAQEALKDSLVRKVPDEANLTSNLTADLTLEVSHL